MPAAVPTSTSTQTTSSTPTTTTTKPDDESSSTPSRVASRPLGAADADHTAAVIVHTTYGPVRGEQRTSYLGERFYSFRSIPYARPPLGDLRFRDPQPPQPWKQPLDARHECVAAPFVDPTETAAIRTSEDCLLLNVYTTQLPGVRDVAAVADVGADVAGRPVMVWLHGGSFRAGSSSEHMYGPDFLLSDAAVQPGVVVVTVNYRLGALGFLSLHTPAVCVPGNAGLKDQTLALRWVRQNAAAFGGDASNVTLFGNSAGACAVHLHMLSPHSAGLFDRAIVQSGTALAEWANFPKNDWTRRLAERLGWTGSGSDSDDDDASMLAFLRAASAESIVAHQDEILTDVEKQAGIFSFGPATESYRAEQSFMVEDPRRLVGRNRPWSAHVPLVIGATSDEGLLMWRSMRRNAAFFQSAAGFELLVPAEFGLAPGGTESAELAQQIRRFYHGDAPSTLAANGSCELDSGRTMQAWGDRAFWLGIHWSIMARLGSGVYADDDDGGQAAVAPTYLYRYAGESGRFNWKKLQFVGEDKPGASHADEVHYLFKCALLVERLPHDSRELKRMRTMVSMWTHFAATGNPNCATMGDTVWEPITAAPTTDRPHQCLNITDTLGVIDLPESDRIAFWDQLYRDNFPPMRRHSSRPK